MPENDDEWRRIRLADALGMTEHALILSAYLNPRSPSFSDPRKEEMRLARINRKMPTSGQDVTLEDMGGDEFTTTPSEQRVMTAATLEALKGAPDSVVMLIPQDNGGLEDEGVMVFDPLHGGIGVLTAKKYGLFNALLLNLELRTGHYGCCRARVDEEGEPIVRLDLARYEVCYNRCQRLLHELCAGAQYDSA